MQLSAQYRPQVWSEMVGQDAIVAQVDALRKRGLGGRAYWITGSTGMGKSTTANLLAREIAGTLAINGKDAQGENARDVDLDYVRHLENTWHQTALPSPGSDKTGRAWIFNESHQLRPSVCERLLTTLDDGCIPSHAIVIFTTNQEEDTGLFEGYNNAPAFLARCKKLRLSRRVGSALVGAHALKVAKLEGLAPELDDETLLKWCDRLAKDCANSFRAVLDQIEDGYLLSKANRKEMAGAA